MLSTHVESHVSDHSQQSQSQSQSSVSQATVAVEVSRRQVTGTVSVTATVTSKLHERQRHPEPAVLADCQTVSPDSCPRVSSPPVRARAVGVTPARRAHPYEMHSPV